MMIMDEEERELPPPPVPTEIPPFAGPEDLPGYGGTEVLALVPVVLLIWLIIIIAVKLGGS